MSFLFGKLPTHQCFIACCAPPQLTPPLYLNPDYPVGPRIRSCHWLLGYWHQAIPNIVFIFRFLEVGKRIQNKQPLYSTMMTLSLFAVYIYIYICLSLCLSLSLSIAIPDYLSICVFYINKHIYIYMHYLSTCIIIHIYILYLAWRVIFHHFPHLVLTFSISEVTTSFIPWDMDSTFGGFLGLLPNHPFEKRLLHGFFSINISIL